MEWPRVKKLLWVLQKRGGNRVWSDFKLMFVRLYQSRKISYHNSFGQTSPEIIFDCCTNYYTGATPNRTLESLSYSIWSFSLYKMGTFCYGPLHHQLEQNPSPVQEDLVLISMELLGVLRRIFVAKTLIRDTAVNWLYTFGLRQTRLCSNNE